MLSEQDFLDWLIATSSQDSDFTDALANDVARSMRPLRCNEAAALLTAVDHIAPAHDNTASSSIAFIVVGMRQPEEHLLANALASALQLRVTQDILPDALLIANIQRAIPQLLEGLSITPSNNAPVVNLGADLYLHTPASLRNRLIRAIHLSGNDDQMWQVISILLEIPRRSEARFAVIDIKVGDHLPAVSYDKGMSLARDLLKVSWLANIQCRVLLTDAIASASLAFGAMAELQDLVRSLKGEHEPQYTRIAVELVAQALALMFPGSHAVDAETRAYRVLRSGEAHIAALRWNLPILKQWITLGEDFDVGGRYRLASTLSGYLREVNSSLIRTALVALEQEGHNGMVGGAAALVLPNVGEFVNAGDDLVQIIGKFPLSTVNRLANTFLGACDIASEQPQVRAPVRVLMMLEAVLVRCHAIVIVPVKKKDLGGAVIYIPFTLSGHSLESELPTQLYDSPSVSGEMTEQAYKLAIQMFPPDSVLGLEKIAQVKTEVVTYDPAADALISLHYHVFKVPIMDNWPDEASDETRTREGRWLTLEDIEALEDQDLGPALHSIRNVIKNWVL